MATLKQVETDTPVSRVVGVNHPRSRLSSSILAFAISINLGWINTISAIDWNFIGGPAAGIFVALTLKREAKNEYSNQAIQAADSRATDNLN